MARSIPIWLSPLLEQLELERPELVGLRTIENFAKDAGMDVPSRMLAARLKELGWLLDTPQRGVWEFIPAEVAGAYSSSDPLIPIKAFSLANPTIDYALTFQTAAWALGLADRVPTRIDVAFQTQPKVKVPSKISSSAYTSNLVLKEEKGCYVLSPEAVAVHMTQRPSAVRSWQGVLEWLPDVAYEIEAAALLLELETRPSSVWVRTGYLLQGLRPDIAATLFECTPPKAKIRFGTRGQALRNDEHWMISDYCLPFNPKELGPVK